MAQQADSNDGLKQTIPMLCVGQCGFFGNPVTLNMCSKCYRDYKQKESSKVVQVEIPPNNVQPDRLVETEKMEVEVIADKPKETLPAKEVQADTTKCWSCKKKVGLLGFKCKCSYVYCSKHRYPGQHVCDFDFKAEGKKEIEKNNPVIKASKINPL